MKNIKLAIWDWNGTLWNDVDQWFIAAQAAYSHALEGKEITLEQLTDVFDVPVSDVIYALGAPRDLPQSKHDAVLQAFKSTLYAHDHLASVRTGASDALTFMESRKISNQIASNHPLELLQNELQKSGLAKFFNGICGNDNHDTVYSIANKEARVIAIIEKAGIDPSQACIIADTREEVRIAQKLGMVSIAITGGYNSQKVLRDMNPTHLLHSMTDIPKLFLGS